MGTAPAIRGPAGAPLPGGVSHGRIATGRARTGTTARFVLPAARESLEDGRNGVRRALRAEGWRPEAVEPVVLAVSEALTNAVDHGSNPGARVTVTISTAGRRACVRVIDQGRPGAACPVQPPAPPAPSSEHGRGLIIMAAIARFLEVRHWGDGTEVRLEFTRGCLRGA